MCEMIVEECCFVVMLVVLEMVGLVVGIARLYVSWICS